MCCVFIVPTSFYPSPSPRIPRNISPSQLLVLFIYFSPLSSISAVHMGMVGGHPQGCVPSTSGHPSPNPRNSLSASQPLPIAPQPGLGPYEPLLKLVLRADLKPRIIFVNYFRTLTGWNSGGNHCFSEVTLKSALCGHPASITEVEMLAVHLIAVLGIIQFISNTFSQLGVETHVCNPGTWDDRGARSRVQGLPLFHGKFEASLSLLFGVF